MDMRCMDTQKVNKACKFIMIGSVAGHQRMGSLKDVLKLMMHEFLTDVLH